MTRINYVTADCRVEAILKRLSQVEDVESYLSEVLDATIMAAGADMGTLQRFDDDEDCLRIVASRGFPDHVLKYFEIVRRDSHTSCGAALKRRMRVVVDDVSTSYLYVGTPELDLLRKSGVAAVHSTPIISHSARLWGVISTYFRKPQPESQYDPAPLDRLAVQLADHMEKFDSEFTARSAAKS